MSLEDDDLNVAPARPGWYALYDFLPCASPAPELKDWHHYVVDCSARLSPEQAEKLGRVMDGVEAKVREGGGVVWCHQTEYRERGFLEEALAQEAECFYCKEPSTGICPECGAQVCDDHTTPDGECSLGGEECDHPLHVPGDMEDWLDREAERYWGDE